MDPFSGAKLIESRKESNGMPPGTKNPEKKIENLYKTPDLPPDGGRYVNVQYIDVLLFCFGFEDVSNFHEAPCYTLLRVAKFNAPP